MPMLFSPVPPTAAEAARLHRYRLLLIALVAGAHALADAVLGLDLPWAMLALVLGGWLLLGQAARALRLATLLQFGLDLVLLTVVFATTGGFGNPLVSLYLLPLALGATLLRRRLAWMLTGLAVGMATLLIVVWTPAAVGLHTAHAAQHPHALSGGLGYASHLVGMWLSFVAAAGLLVHFTGAMAVVLRRRERELAAVREQTLRDRQVLALGALAAGAAHELGTPLATIAVLARELELDHAGDAALAADLATLRTQVEHCKHAISSLLAAAGQARVEAAGTQALDVWLETLLARWQTLRPAVPVQLQLAAGASPSILTDDTLAQSLVSLLNNAADVSPAGIGLRADWEGGGLRLAVLDDGPGLPARAGEPHWTGKLHGRGLGIFLARAAIERLGGELRYTLRPEGGTCAEIRLPNAALAVNPT